MKKRKKKIIKMSLKIFFRMQSLIAKLKRRKCEVYFVFKQRKHITKGFDTAKTFFLHSFRIIIIKTTETM